MTNTRDNHAKHYVAKVRVLEQQQTLIEKEYTYYEKFQGQVHEAQKQQDFDLTPNQKYLN